MVAGTLNRSCECWTVPSYRLQLCCFKSLPTHLVRNSAVEMPAFV